MRRHDTDNADGSTRGRLVAVPLLHRRRALASLLLASLAVLALLLSATPALAATITDRPFLFTFNGSDSTAGRFDALISSSIAVDNSTGAVYVGNGSVNPWVDGSISKFNPDGVAVPFTPGGPSSLWRLPGHRISTGVRLSVDNSGGPNQGNIYAGYYELEGLDAFAPDGSSLWTAPAAIGSYGETAVDSSGHPWLISTTGGPMNEFADTGSPPALIGSFTLSPAGDRIDFDAAGNCYIRPSFGQVQVEKFTACNFASTPTVLDPGGASFPWDVYVNQSTTLPSPSLAGHIFTSYNAGRFNEYSAAGALLANYGASYLGQGSAAIAYSPTSDRVYVTDSLSNLVVVFGPVTTGTVPDPTYGSTTSIGISTAHFSGSVNPQSVANSYHFEWKKHSAAGWVAAETSPDASLPVDSNPHSVSFDATTLFGNTDYDVRLVAENTANKLRSFSAVDTFHTATAPAPPVLGTPTVPTIGTTTATVAATIAAQGDSALWQLQTSTDPACATGFSAAGPQNAVHPPQEPNISQGLSGLLPNQHYCVRVAATNSAGTATSAVAQFTTDPIPPDQVVTGFAAPRTDTSARLNAYVNPEGADLTYHFEYRADGEAGWTVRDPLVSSLDSRTQILVSDLVPNLQPDTTYHYRFFASNAAGPASPQGSELTFTTRPAPPNPPCPNAGVRAAQRSAYLPDCRGIELVNQPDKGNQNPVVSPFFPAAGEDLRWTVAAGAPGSPTGALGIFLSTRAPTESPSGWKTQSVLPPADQLEGAGLIYYRALTASSDFSRFLVAPGNATAGALLRCDRAQHCEALVHFPTSDTEDQAIEGSGVDTSADLAHVVTIDHSTNPPQLKDFGAGTPAPVLSVMPDGKSSACGMEDEGKSFVGGGASGIGPAPLWRPGYHMIATTDASRVYFQAQPNKPAPNSNQCDSSAQFGLYVRNRETATTTLIDPGTGVDTADFRGSPHFIRAGADGRSAFFLTYSKLDPVADTNSDADVYRWDEQAGPSGSHYTCLTCVVPDANVAAGSGPATKPILVSDDSSRVYFTSTSRLVPGRGVAGDLNLYVLSGGQLRFVADPNLGNSALQSARITPDGNVLLLPSDRPLTTDPIAPSCTSSSTSTPHDCVELYRYDDTDAGLECLSCARGGLTTHDIGNDAGGTGSNDVKFDLSADGGTVAFTTTGALLPADVNATADIYEWHDGVLSLITDGLTKFKGGNAAPALVGVGDSGRDLFFTLDQPGLTGYEQDLLANVYDARIDGGFTPPTPVAHCTEDSCQGPLQAAPALDLPASSSFSGRGNSPSSAAKPKKRRCAKGKRKVRRAGKVRCVSRRKQERKSHRKQAGGANHGRSK